MYFSNLIPAISDYSAELSWSQFFEVGESYTIVRVSRYFDHQT